MRISNKLPQYLMDSNFLIALLDARDVHHKKATKLLEEIHQAQSIQLFISDILINEVLSVFAKRCEAQKRSNEFASLVKEVQSAVRDMPILCLYDLVPKHYKAITDIMIQWKGRFNFHDALLILFLTEVPKVNFITFDRDFKALSSLSISCG